MTPPPPRSPPNPPLAATLLSPLALRPQADMVPWIGFCRQARPLEPPPAAKAERAFATARLPPLAPFTRAPRLVPYTDSEGEFSPEAGRPGGKWEQPNCKPRPGHPYVPRHIYNDPLPAKPSTIARRHSQGRIGTPHAPYRAHDAHQATAFVVDPRHPDLPRVRPMFALLDGDGYGPGRLGAKPAWRLVTLDQAEHRSSSDRAAASLKPESSRDSSEPATDAEAGTGSESDSGIASHLFSPEHRDTPGEVEEPGAEPAVPVDSREDPQIGPASWSYRRAFASASMISDPALPPACHLLRQSSGFLELDTYRRSSVVPCHRNLWANLLRIRSGH